jgi:hypothetical protein
MSVLIPSNYFSVHHGPRLTNGMFLGGPLGRWYDQSRRNRAAMWADFAAIHGRGAGRQARGVGHRQFGLPARSGAAQSGAGHSSHGEDVSKGRLQTALPMDSQHAHIGGFAGRGYNPDGSRRGYGPSQ